MVLAWVVDKIFEQKDGIDDPNEPVDKKKEQEKFRSYLCENTPWFLGGAATCIIDLPNIEQIATGSYKKKIELWDLKTESNKNFDMDLESSAIMGGSTKDKKIKGSKKNKTIDEIKVHEEKAKEPLKRLEGHRMAIREIAYSESYKILVSVGFDFKVMVWNPYSKDAVMKLDGHESPLVGVNCPKGLDCFITCDNKGVINVWNIKDYSCLQSFNVAGVN
jgi:WD40 repeat protein